MSVITNEGADMIDRPERDLPLLVKVLEHVTAHPEEHDQSVWAQQTPCGTAMCVAGHTATMCGWDIDRSFWSPMTGFSQVRRAGCAERRHVSDVAAEALGLTADEADVLFDGWNTLADLWWVARKIGGDEVVVPEGAVHLEAADNAPKNWCWKVKAGLIES